MRRRLSNSTPRKNECCLISWAPERPKRFSVLQIKLAHVSTLEHLRSWTYSPSNQVLGFHTKLDIIREVQRLSPVDNLAVCIVTVLSAERRPSDQTLEHNGA